jgi:hypothetical protein
MPIQNHIHLSMTLQPSGEKAPDIKWTTIEELLTPEITVSTTVTLDGSLRKHKLMRDGQQVKLLHGRYRLKVDDYGGLSLEQRLDALFEMQGEDVYLVDHRHVNDTEDHTPNVRKMFFVKLGDYDSIAKNVLTRYYLEIQLLDDQFRS